MQEGFLTTKLDLILRKKLVQYCIWSKALCDAKTGHFGRWIRNTWKDWKCGAGDG